MLAAPPTPKSTLVERLAVARVWVLAFGVCLFWASTAPSLQLTFENTPGFLGRSSSGERGRERGSLEAQPQNCCVLVWYLFFASNAPPSCPGKRRQQQPKSRNFSFRTPGTPRRRFPDSPDRRG